ncbi:DNA gyrase subunit A [Escherichia coli]
MWWNISIEGLIGGTTRGRTSPAAAMMTVVAVLKKLTVPVAAECIWRITKSGSDTKTGGEIIIVHEIPYQVNKFALIRKIAELVKEKRVEGISALRDAVDKDGMRIVIEVKRDAVGEVVLNNLYSQTQLQVSFGINMVALHHGQPKIMNLKSIIAALCSSPP